MSKSDGLICAYAFDKKGARELDWQGIGSWEPGTGFLWIHLDRRAPETHEWLVSRSGLDAITCEALLAEETRPRSITIGNALVVILRGVNLNPGADPEDMVSVRIWLDADRIITVRGQKLLAIQDIRESISAGRGPASTGEFIALLAARLVERMGPVVDSLDDELSAIEEELLEKQSRELRVTLSGLRHQAVALRRYLSPQRDVISRLSIESLPWLKDLHRARLRETADRTTRYVEDLDAARERAAVTQEELMARAQDRMNKNMYVLSLVAAVFLPLGFVTGLLGINVGGIPGSESSTAFLMVCLFLGVVAAAEIALFYFRRWL
ncbi:MAG: magnesium transporter CorA [Latescibacteria bacterium DG_63]|nr:MAG: magnesium transporter CorA [Latescibacteria bacterium DG_63]